MTLFVSSLGRSGSERSGSLRIDFSCSSDSFYGLAGPLSGMPGYEQDNVLFSFYGVSFVSRVFIDGSSDYFFVVICYFLFLVVVLAVWSLRCPCLRVTLFSKDVLR